MNFLTQIRTDRMSVEETKEIISTTLCLLCIKLKSPSAITQLLYTDAQESHLNEWVRQMGFSKDNFTSGAFGMYQMELATHDYTWRFIKKKYPEIHDRILSAFNLEEPPRKKKAAEMLMQLPCYATIMARMYYAKFKEPLPDANDLLGIANYWKKYWNTYRGKGTVKQFIQTIKAIIK